MEQVWAEPASAPCACAKGEAESSRPMPGVPRGGNKPGCRIARIAPTPRSRVERTGDRGPASNKEPRRESEKMRAGHGYAGDSGAWQGRTYGPSGCDLYSTPE